MSEQWCIQVSQLNQQVKSWYQIFSAREKKKFKSHFYIFVLYRSPAALFHTDDITKDFVCIQF